MEKVRGRPGDQVRPGALFWEEKMGIREAIKERTLFFDGAFGTYYAQKSGSKELPEYGNISNPGLVEEIHTEYVYAGADIIRTNTFASNSRTISRERQELKKNLESACKIAKGVAERAAAQMGKTVYVAGDIGPLPCIGEEESEEAGQEYLFLAETLLSAGADFLLFETFPDYRGLLPVIHKIKEKKPDLFVMVHFAVNQYGYTNTGIRARKIFKELEKDTCVDGLGLNCGVGPGHMLRIYGELPFSPDKVYSALPNASYPKLLQNRIVFLENREYFAGKLSELSKLGIHCLGGCCGTAPEYIRQAVGRMDGKRKNSTIREARHRQEEKAGQPAHAFYGNQKKTLVAVELAPPFGANDEKVLEAACYLKSRGVDVATFPDSPSGRTRADSILMGVKAMEKSGITVMPHICCRDKNAIAVRSQLLGAYMNGIRNLLVVTGDPVPTLLRNDVKSVYNFDSVGLMRILQEMNEEEFAQDPFVYGGALNPARVNLQVEIARMKKKLAAGATFFLTQPLFTDEDIENLRRIREEVPARILCGIMPLVSRKNALFMKNEMAGIHVTEEIVSRYDNAVTREEGEAVGVALAREIMEKTRELADGYYFSIPFNRVELLAQIFRET